VRRRDEERLTQDPYLAARQRMVRDQLSARGVGDRATLAAIGLVPREAFVPAADRGRAYHDGALAIGGGQTISQPYIVARMTESLAPSDLGWPWTEDRPTFLDVGTGSGYQAAVLAQLGGRVTSIERDPDLAAAARDRLASLGYEVEVVVGDGSVGYPPNAPYSGVIVAAAAPSVPPPLVEQLTQGGRLVIPIGSRQEQRLTVVRRLGDSLETIASDACVFVPLLGEHGHPG